jgi:regulator of sigma E protease
MYKETVGVLVMIGQFLLGMSLLVTIHELGHFIAAKFFGISVKKFYIFFDAFGLSLFKFSYKGTIYGIGWLPLGGYIKMSGMYEAEEDIDPTDSGNYYTKPAWQRITVMLSGVLMNLLMAFVVFSGLSVGYGDGYIHDLKVNYSILPPEVSKQAGLSPGDRIVEVNGEAYYTGDDLTSTRILRGNTKLTVIRKKGEEQIHIHLDVSPKTVRLFAEKGFTEFFSIGTEFKIDSVYANSDLKTAGLTKKDRITAVDGKPVNLYDEFLVKLNENKDKKLLLTIVHEGKTSKVFAHRDRDGHIGFSLSAVHPKKKLVEITLPESLSFGADRAWAAFSDNIIGLNDIAQGKIKATDALTGPVGIAVLFGKNPDWKRFWSLVAVLSAALAFINLVPIPVLDGGQVLFLAIEVIRGKPLKTSFIEYGMGAGFVLLIGLSLFVLYSDIAWLLQK